MKEEDRLEELTALAHRLLESNELNREEYRRIEDYIIGETGRGRKSAGIERLEGLADEIARRHHLPSIRSQQENFGLNSCAQ